MQKVNTIMNSCKTTKHHLLDLSNHNLTELEFNNKDLAIKDLTHITELYLYRNKLVSVSEQVGSLVNLKKIGLSENHLVALPDSLVNLSNLIMLDLRLVYSSLSAAFASYVKRVYKKYFQLYFLIVTFK